MAQITKPKLGKERFLRILFRVLFFGSTVLAPLLLMYLQFNFIKTASVTKVRVSFICIIIAIVIIKRFGGQIKEWINGWEYSPAKYIILGLSKNIFWIILLVSSVLISYKLKGWVEYTTAQLVELQSKIQKFLLLFVEISLFELLGYCIFYPLEQKFDYIIKRELRKQETREVNDELLDELEKRLKK